MKVEIAYNRDIRLFKSGKTDENFLSKIKDILAMLLKHHHLFEVYNWNKLDDVHVRFSDIDTTVKTLNMYVNYRLMFVENKYVIELADYEMEEQEDRYFKCKITGFQGDQ